MGKAFNLIAACAMLAGASGAFGQVKCTMPNGKTITLSSTPRCPADATKWATLEGQDITPADAPKAAQIKQPPTPAQKKVESYVVQPKQVIQKDPYDAAISVCQSIKKATGSFCIVEQYSAPLNRLPSIKVWVEGTKEESYERCHAVVLSARTESGGSMSDRGWKVKIYSQHSIDVPLAQCAI